MKVAWQRAGVMLGLGVWLAAAAGALGLLARYRFTEGAAGPAPMQLPTGLRDGSAQPTLLLALHPHCPCSRATLAELARLRARTPVPCRVVTLVFQPKDEPADWLDSGLVAEARRLSAEIRPDEDGKLAGELGLLTSGQALLYDATGRLRFQGGLTAGRGHEGASAGQIALEQILRGDDLPLTRPPVYGCPLTGR